MRLLRKLVPKEYKPNDFVFVNPDRGRTPGIARVIKILPHKVARIRYDNGEEDSFFFVHLHQTGECMKRRLAFLKERAEKVGKKCA
jgi:hypothetical protein